MTWRYEPPSEADVQAGACPQCGDFDYTGTFCPNCGYETVDEGPNCCYGD